MAKKSPASKQPATGGPQQLIDAIATVKQLQDFIKEHGDIERALAAATRVHGLIEMTGGFAALRQALEIVGKEPAA
jgi:hypothetical protein